MGVDVGTEVDRGTNGKRALNLTFGNKRLTDRRSNQYLTCPLGVISSKAVDAATSRLGWVSMVPLLRGSQRPRFLQIAPKRSIHRRGSTGRIFGIWRRSRNCRRRSCGWNFANPSAKLDDAGNVVVTVERLLVWFLIHSIIFC